MGNDPETRTHAQKNAQGNVLRRIREWSLNHFFITFFALFILNSVVLLLSRNIHVIFPLISFLLLAAYVILFLINKIRNNIIRLLHHELHFGEIFTGYVTSVIFIVLLFSILYWGMTALGIGYLKYGSCVDNNPITRMSMENDPLLVRDIMHYPYFSAITFFTVGFGDICPMGISKLITTLNALIGNAFTVLILAIAITNYSSNKDNKDNKDNKKEENKKENTALKGKP